MGFSNENLAVTLLPVEVESYISDFFGGGAIPTLAGSGTGASVAQWEATLTLPNIEFAGGTDLGWNAEINLLEVEVSATGVSSSVASADGVLPKLKITATMSASSGVADVSLPQITITASGYTEIDWDAANLVVPQLTTKAFVESALAAVFEAWCMNLNTSGVSEYVDFPVTSMARFNGKYYATTTDGIYELTGGEDGTTDIDSSVLTGVTDYSHEKDTGDSAMKIKRSGGAYVNLRSQDEFSVVVKVDEDKERVYTVNGSGDPSGVHPRRVNLGRLLEGRNWQFGFRNINGADFTVKDFQNIPIFTSRRI